MNLPIEPVLPADGAPAAEAASTAPQQPWQQPGHASNAQLTGLLDSLDDGLAIIGSDWRLAYANAAARRMLQPCAAGPHTDLWQAFPDLCGSPAEQALRHAMAQRTGADVELPCSATAGRLAWRVQPDGHGLRCHIRPLPAGTGARHGEQHSEQHGEQDLRALADSIPQLAWIAGHDGAMVWHNQRWYDYTGTTPQQVLGTGWRQVYAPDCLAQLEQKWRQALRSGDPFEMELPIRGTDGQFRWFLTRANPVRDARGAVVRWFGTSTDVDQVKRVEEALRDETTVLELLNRTGTALASTRDLQPLLQEVTDAATRVSGARFGAFFHHGGAPVSASDLLLYTLSSDEPEPPADPQETVWSPFSEPRAAELLGPLLSGSGILRSDDLLYDTRHDRALPRALATPGRPPLRSYLAMPVVSRSGRVLGSLLFGHTEPRMFNARTERIVAGIAAQAAVAIDNALLYEAAQQAAEERKLLLDSERSARAEAERNSQMKDDFLSTLSHELRTPLTAILGWAQVLRRGTRDQADLHRGLQTIERNARAQAQLIEDLLDMSRIASGQVRLEMLALDPGAIVQAAIDSVRLVAEAREIRVAADIAPDAGWVAGDPIRLQQIIWNLLTNALKFTPRGGNVQVTVRPLAAQVDRRNQPDQVEIAVCDSGIGIGPEFIEHVFERFRQADASTTRKHGGLGLGLAIVKHLAEQHGGSVAVASAGEGQGACFSLRLPRKPVANAPTGGMQAAATLAGAPAGNGELALRDLTGLQVLVVDDEADARELIKRILNDCNAEVLTAATATEALSLLQDARPDLMVSDIGMPDIDGYGLLDRIRALGPARGGDLPAIALTAFARSEDRVKALACGFLAHLSKPVEPAELIAKVAATWAEPRKGEARIGTPLAL